LCNTKDKIIDTEKLCIYQIQGEDCDKNYTGQTRRNIDIIFKELIRKELYKIKNYQSLIAENFFEIYSHRKNQINLN